MRGLVEMPARWCGALVAAHLILAVQENNRDSTWAGRTRAASGIAEEQLRQVRGLLDAVRLIEQECFDGHRVLIGEGEERLVMHIEAAELFAGYFRDARTGSHEERAASAAPADAEAEQLTRARTQASEWINMAKVKTHEKMGEPHQGYQMAIRALTREGKSGRKGRGHAAK